MTKQTAFPARFVVNEDITLSSKKSLDDNVRPLTAQLLTDPKVMALGPIAWLKPDSHPKIKHVLTSTTIPAKFKIYLDGYRQNVTIKDNQTDDVEQYKASNDDKSRHLTSGTREAAGIKGREVCYYFPQGPYGSSPYVWCSWGTDGERENLDRPFMEITMDYKVDGSETQTKQAMAAWQQLMNSLKKCGHS